MAKEKYTRHHRKCKSHGGSDLPNNISMVTEKRHEAWHTLFENKTTEQIVQELNDVWINPEYVVSFEKVVSKSTR